MDIINTSGRRKASVARIYMSAGKGKVTVNKKTVEDYFPREIDRIKIGSPFAIVEEAGNFDLKVNVAGGGLTGQSEAIRLAVSKALCIHNLEYRGALKAKGLLRRDDRVVERKKPGQKKARKKFQFSKR
jgi:small subunit ribosomal protein S9